MIAIEFLPRWRPELSVGIDEIDGKGQVNHVPKRPFRRLG